MELMKVVYLRRKRGHDIRKISNAVEEIGNGWHRYRCPGREKDAIVLPKSRLFS